MMTYTTPGIVAASVDGAIVRCAGPERCGSAYCFNGDVGSADREESERAAERRRWRRVNKGWICPDCAAKL